MFFVLPKFICIDKVFCIAKVFSIAQVYLYCSSLYPYIQTIFVNNANTVIKQVFNLNTKTSKKHFLRSLII